MHAFTHAHMHTFTRMHAHTHSLTHKHMHTHTHVHTHTHIHTLTQQTNMYNTHAYTHTRTHTYTHTHTHTHTHTLSPYFLPSSFTELFHPLNQLIQYFLLPGQENSACENKMFLQSVDEWYWKLLINCVLLRNEDEPAIKMMKTRSKKHKPY